MWNQNFKSVCQPKNCFKFEITLCHLVFIHLITTPNGAKLKLTFDIRCDVSKQTLTLTKNRRHFSVLLFCKSCENLHYYHQNLFYTRDGSKVNHIWLSFIQFIQRIRHQCHNFTYFSISVDGNMAVIFFSSQNKSSSGERDSLIPCNMHLTPCNIYRLLLHKKQCRTLLTAVH